MTINQLNKIPVQQFIKNDSIQELIKERLEKRAGQFTTSLLSLINGSPKLAECTPMTVVQSALTAASLDLPINQNLGFAYIIPYGKVAQLQIGYKGFIQLAQRSGKFKTINTTDVRLGEVSTRDRMTGELSFDWCQDNKERSELEVVGYVAYFELLNGFNKSLYMTKAEIEAHASKYSQAYKSRNNSSFDSPWKTEFDLMAQKTVLKLLLSKYAPLSTEMQDAIVSDQSVDDGNELTYIDNIDILQAEKATEEEKDEIVEVNKTALEEVQEVFPEAKEIKIKPETVAEKAQRLWGKKDDNSPSD